jgi:AraC-like DNA-binding protein
MTFEMSSFEHLAPLRGNTVEINNKASEFIEMLTDIYNSSINGSANACTVTLLAGLLLNEVRKGKEINYEPSGGFMDEVNKYIYMNLKKQLKLSDIAARFSYSPSRFRAVYREAMGIPPGRYIREMRLHKAQEYLAGTSTRISKIATLCGYDSVYSFSHAFRDYTNFSPSEFRRKYSV